MRYKRLKLGAVFLLVFGLTEIQAQQSVNASGGDATGSGGWLSYTIGQLDYKNDEGTSGSVAQGVQHAFEIFKLDLEEVDKLNASVLIYPNPSTEFLTLEMNELDFTSISYQLYDLQGRLLRTEKISAQKTSIDMRSLPAATYFIKLNQGSSTIQSFKVIKK